MSYSEKKEKQIKDLIELNDELENYFKNTIIPQLFVDANLILRKFTPPAMKQFDFSPDDLGKPFKELVDNIRYSTIVEDVDGVIKTGEILEKEIQTTDFRWFQMNIIPYRVKIENKTNGVIITFVDITDRIKTLQELEKLIASHETFIYSVSHDLKGPLSNIEGLVKNLVETSSSLKSGKDDQEQQNIAVMLERSILIMRNIINELSEVARVESHYNEEAENVKLLDIIDEAKLTLNDQIVNYKARLHLDIKVTELSFSRKYLRSIIYNLMSNALKYRAPDRIPEIHLKSEKVDGYIQITIKDNGLGIEENKKDLLFTPYSRLEKNVEGTGIGLYLVKKIILNEGGQILVKSQYGQGTEFIVNLSQE